MPMWISPSYDSVVIPAAMLAALAASALVFWALNQRWIKHRQWFALSSWAAEQRFKLRRDPAAPAVLERLSDPPPRVDVMLWRAEAMLMRISTPPCRNCGALLHDQHEDDDPATSGTSAPAQWNLLLRRIDSDWPVTALRPARQLRSAADLWSMTSFPQLAPPERFVLYGVNERAAKELAGSWAMSLIPPDLGLILVGEWLILDFSARPFDEIEFERVLSLAGQLLEHLPAVVASGKQGVA